MDSSKPVLNSDIQIRLNDIHLSNERDIDLVNTSLKDRLILKFIQFNTSYDSVDLRLKGFSYFFDLINIDENSFYVDFCKFKYKNNIFFPNERSWIDSKKYKIQFNNDSNSIYASLQNCKVAGLKGKFNIKHRTFTIQCDTDFDDIWYSLLDHLDII